MTIYKNCSYRSALLNKIAARAINRKKLERISSAKPLDNDTQVSDPGPSWPLAQNGRMLTSSDLDQRSAKFGSLSNSSDWCFLLKFGRCGTAALMNHADFAYFTFQRFITSSLL